jgi:hypothetical protein
MIFNTIAIPVTMMFVASYAVLTDARLGDTLESFENEGTDEKSNHSFPSSHKPAKFTPGISPYIIYFANTQDHDLQAGILDGPNGSPINNMTNNRIKPNRCVKLSNTPYYTDDIPYFVNPVDGSGGLIVPEIAQCNLIGNLNNVECDLQLMVWNACVITI